MIRYQEGGFTQSYGADPYAQQSQESYLTDFLTDLGLTIDPTQGLAGQMTGGITQDSLMNLIKNKFGISDKIEMDPAMFSKITPGMFQATESGFYDPALNVGRQSHEDTLLDTLRGRKGTGFAHHGGRERDIRKARDMYGKGVESVQTDIGKLQGDAYQSILDSLTQSVGTGIDLRYG